MSIEDAVAGMIITACLGLLAGFWIAIKAERKRYAGAITKSDLVPLRKAADELVETVKRRVSNS